MGWLPRWLGECYSLLYARFEEDVFTFKDAEKVLRRKNSTIRAILSHLREKGHLVDRGRRGRTRLYSLISPVKACMIISAQKRVKESIQQPYARLLARYVQRLFQFYGQRVVSILVFGSVSRGEAKPGSDLDVLLVVEGLGTMMERYGEATKLEEGPVSEEVVRLWKEAKRYISIQPHILTPEEAETTRPLYLDLTVDSIVIYDKKQFMENVLNEVSKRLSELGSRRVKLKDGSWLWLLKPQVEEGEVIEI